MPLIALLAAHGGTPIVYIAIVIIVVGILLWLANSYLPMAPPTKKILNVVVVVALVLWLLFTIFGGTLAHLTSVRI